MKLLIFIFFLHFVSLTPISSNRRTVYLQIKDSSAVPSTLNSPFFESPKSKSVTLKFSINKQFPPSKFTFSGLKHYLSNKNLLLSCNKKDSQILSIKSYWRESGFLPSEDVRKELKSANNFKFYTPNLLETQRIAQFIFFNKSIPANNEKILIKHQILGVCTSCVLKGKRNFQHFLIDRNANAEFPDVWNSKVRVIYVGQGESCQKDDKGWVEKKVSSLHIKDETFNLKGDYTMTRLLKDAKNYLRSYPVYNALYNCQHFATNLYNKITKKNEEFISKDLMIMNDQNGVSNEGKLKYDFQ